MLRFFKSFFNKTNEPKSRAPYKVEVDTFQPVPAVDIAPEPAKCGCGRSASGFCVGLHKLTTEEWAVHPDNPAKPVAEVKAPAAKAHAAKAPAAKKTPAKKNPAAEKASTKPAAMTAAKKRPSKKTPV